MKGRKADYTDRPLTNEEKVFSANLENYNQFFKYMRIHKLDQEEWYDILIIPYLQAVKKYLSIPRLQQYDFGAVLFKTLDSARSNYYRNQNRQKKVPLNMICSLDWEMDDMNCKKKMASWMWIDTKQSVEKDILDKEVITEVLLLLNDMQKVILIKMLEGYTQNSIAEEIGVSIWILRKVVKQIKSIVADHFSI